MQSARLIIFLIFARNENELKESMIRKGDALGKSLVCNNYLEIIFTF